MKNVKTGTVKIYDRIEPLRAEWEHLAARTESEPFLWPGWVSAWWDAFREGELRILAAYRDGRLVGVLPLRRSGEVLSSTENEQEPLNNILAESDAAARLLLEALFSQGAHRIDLTLLDANEDLVSLVRATANTADYEVLARSIQKVPYVQICETTWEAYHSSLPRRRSLRRCRRRLEEEGRLTLKIYDGKERLEELLEEGFRVEGSGWKGATGTSINSSWARRHYYTEVARWAAREGWLRLAFLRLNGRALAFDYCLEGQGIHYLVKTGYDPAYGRFSPGKVLREHMLSRAFSEGITTYELLGALDPWKREWANACHELRSLHMFAREGVERGSWFYQLYLAVQEITKLIPPGETFVLVDEDSWHIDVGGGRRPLLFIERDGVYWGPPADDETAIGELERLRGMGANFMVFGWPAFWWLEYYDGLRRHLRSRYRCLLENERVIVFDLQRK